MGIWHPHLGIKWGFGDLLEKGRHIFGEEGGFAEFFEGRRLVIIAQGEEVAKRVDPRVRPIFDKGVENFRGGRQSGGRLGLGAFVCLFVCLFDGWLLIEGDVG